ncbi:methyladenine glycosylase family protein [Candidatus Endolissoclinum faulkneri L2]|uniref:Methyladenine glycosylase family protein n=1 Tax=Candidatus Endolissoclinum faulkneri L2 TaxID=1193729 RepID=K7YQM4_9PROT|nr:DNA-3-methyladenine glycosylase I [Candidatus Endolissoclinum faulkneri]AFX98849.1 methyladenine glycosylase family protein [Candidatus Endolissoclinum faulkneri L2]
MMIDGITSCCSLLGMPYDYVTYHNNEWGRPVFADNLLFEAICLESFQSGLSWLTVLRKRDALRLSFAGFDFYNVAKFGDAEVKKILNDKKIIRHQGKIRSTINNAQRAVQLVEEAGSLAAFVWSFEPNRNLEQKQLDEDEMLIFNKPDNRWKASISLSQALKKRGWKFLGPRTVYSFMQSVGIINDHLKKCAFWTVCQQEKALFRVPLACKPME